MSGTRWRQRQRWRYVLSASFCGLLGSAAPAWAAPTVITALSEAVVQGATIHLGDVAQVQSDDADLAARMQRVVVGQTPPLGVTRLVSRSTMLIRLRHQGIKAQEVTFQGAQQVRVSRAAQRLQLSELEAAVRQALSQRLQQTAPTMTIRDIRGLHSVSVSPGPVQYEVLTPSRASRPGALRFTLAIQVAGKVERQLTGTASVNRPQERAAPVSAPGGETAASQAVLAPASAGHGDLTTKPAVKPSGRHTPLIIHRGDLVRIVSEAALIKVSTPGEALESGRLGETIRVKNTASNREVKAQVIDQHTVRVLL